MDAIRVQSMIPEERTATRESRRRASVNGGPSVRVIINARQRPLEEWIPGIRCPGSNRGEMLLSSVASGDGFEAHAPSEGVRRRASTPVHEPGGSAREEASTVMPEGRWMIHRVAQRLAKALDGQRTEEVRFGLERRWLQGMGIRDLTGATVTSVRSRGKAMLIGVDSGLTIYSHNQLYGRWDLRRATTAPKPTNRSLRMLIRTPNHAARLYSASDIEVLDPVGLASHPFLAKLGPDLLDPDQSMRDLIDHVTSGRFDRRRLDHLLLDQAFLAGVGTIFAVRSSSNPASTPGGSWGPSPLMSGHDSWNRLAPSPNVPSITTGSRWTRLWRSGLKEEGIARRRYRHYVFTRDGAPCRRCGSEIQHDRVQRTKGRPLPNVSAKRPLIERGHRRSSPQSLEHIIANRTRTNDALLTPLGKGPHRHEHPRVVLELVLMAVQEVPVKVRYRTGSLGMQGALHSGPPSCGGRVSLRRRVWWS